MTRQNYLARLQTAIKATHGLDSRHVESVPITETFEGKTVWDGIVEVYALLGHATARQCYAWAYDTPEGSRVIAVLGVPPITSPQMAVKAACVAEMKEAAQN